VPNQRMMNICFVPRKEEIRVPWFTEDRMLEVRGRSRFGGQPMWPPVTVRPLHLGAREEILFREAGVERRWVARERTAPVEQSLQQDPW